MFYCHDSSKLCALICLRITRKSLKRASIAYLILFLIIVIDSVFLVPFHLSSGTKVLLLDCNETPSVDSVYAEWIIL